MDPLQIHDSDVTEPVRLRQTMQKVYDRTQELLTRLESVEKHPAITTPAADSFTAEERSLLRAMIVGSADNIAAAQKPVLPTVAALPPAAVSISGQMVVFGGAVYRYDSAAGWVLV